MAAQIWLNRTEADELVCLLEHEFRAGRLPGIFADLAGEIREAFGMSKQPSMGFGEDRSLPPYVASQLTTDEGLSRTGGT